MKEKEEILTADVIRAIDIIYHQDFNDDKLSYRNPITDIKSEISNGNILLITITSKRPGIIIGHGGRDINKLTKLLSKHFNQFDKVEIQLIENKLTWYTGYDG